MKKIVFFAFVLVVALFSTAAYAGQGLPKGLDRVVDMTCDEMPVGKARFDDVAAVFDTHKIPYVAAKDRSTITVDYAGDWLPDPISVVYGFDADGLNTVSGIRYLADKADPSLHQRVFDGLVTAYREAVGNGRLETGEHKVSGDKEAYSFLAGDKQVVVFCDRAAGKAELIFAMR